MSCQFLVGLLLLVPAASLSDDKIDGKLLIGKWQAQKLPDGLDKMIVEYLRDGKLTVDVEGQAGKQKLEGTYTLEGNKLTVKVDVNGNEQVQNRKISKLTESELVTVNEDNNEERKYKKVK